MQMHGTEMGKLDRWCFSDSLVAAVPVRGYGFGCRERALRNTYTLHP